jgi:hypothetical protein
MAGKCAVAETAAATGRVSEARGRYGRIAAALSRHLDTYRSQGKCLSWQFPAQDKHFFEGRRKKHPRAGAMPGSKSVDSTLVFALDRAEGAARLAFRRQTRDE